MDVLFYSFIFRYWFKLIIECLRMEATISKWIYIKTTWKTDFLKRNMLVSKSFQNCGFHSEAFNWTAEWFIFFAFYSLELGSCYFCSLFPLFFSNLFYRVECGMSSDYNPNWFLIETISWLSFKILLPEKNSPFQASGSIS